ncbi:MAG: sulfatase-like hydrolase/transferase [Rikenellaceae bacterium]
MKNIAYITLLGSVASLTTLSSCSAGDKKETAKKPNVIFIYADDMGRGMLSHYGQSYLSTPNIDQLFEEGTYFSNAHGCQYSAPARASLLTGYYDVRPDKWKISGGGKFIAEDIEAVIDSVEAEINREDVLYSQEDLLLPQVFKKAGYTTGQVGKLEWGFTATRQQMKAHGWDYYYGYLDHVRCHGFYPPFLFENGEIVYIEGNTFLNCAKAYEHENPENYAKRWNMEGKAQYSQDLFIEKILSFIEDNADGPFFLYHPTQLPHGPIAIPEVHPELKDVEGLTELEKEYGSMVKMLDDNVGQIVAKLKELGIYDNTIIVFSSDNGHETYYMSETRCLKFPERDMELRKFDSWDYAYTSERTGDKFNGNNSQMGKKWSNFEGGIRVPLVFSWKGHIREGYESAELSSNCDLLSTFADMLDVELAVEKDGVSLLPILMDKSDTLASERYVYAVSPIGATALRSDGWKLRQNKDLGEYRLFYLPEDYREENPLNDKHPEVLEEMKKALIENEN